MPLRLSFLPVTPSTPPEGGQGGGFDWSVSDPPQHAAAHRATGTPERGAKEKEGEHQRGGADALGASGEQNPPTHSSRGDFFFKKACCPRQGRGLCAGSTGESTPAERIERGLLVGVVGGAYRYMAVSQYSVLRACSASLNTARALA